MGTNNIAIGNQAAINVSSGNSNNIHLGNVDVAGHSGTIKIGTVGSQSAMEAGML